MMLQSSDDRFNVNLSFSKNWDHLQGKYIGTGHPDMTKQQACRTCGNVTSSEWAVNMHRDTYASHIGHEDMLYFASIAENESVERIRYTMLEVRHAIL